MAAVLSVGQCGYDDSRIGRLVREVSGAFLDRAASADDARRMMGEKKYALILVNRVFDAGGEGMAFIEELKGSGSGVPVMLVSDYADAQARAMGHGAVMGFGKAALATALAGERIREGIEQGNC